MRTGGLAIKILVYGAGVLGCNLARDLFRAGKDVTLLARGNWGEEIQKNGLRIKDNFSPRVSVSRVPVVGELKPEDTYDVIFVAMRQNDLAFEVRDYLKTHPNAAVVNLGCGLDNTGRVCDNGTCRLYNVDFPDVIAVREQLLPAGEREKNVPGDLNDTAWFREIDASGGAVFFASGVFYYFLTEQVRILVRNMVDAFPDGVLVFDAANQTAVKMIAKTWLKGAKIKDVGAYFAVSDAEKELTLWDSRLRVSSRGYMLGYHDLKDPSVSGFFRFMAKVGDGMMKMQIVKLQWRGAEQ